MTTESGASQPAVALPKGGGAIRGIGETFQPNLFSGTGDFSIPIATSPGRSGFGPTLALQYSTGNGNGPFGQGWQLGIPRVSRKTEKGLPRYDDGDDVFVLSGAEDLVPWLTRGVDPTTGEVRWVPEPTITRGDYAVTRYRPRTEGSFARVEQWVKLGGLDAGDVHWRATTKENVTSIYGKTLAARIVDPASRRDPAKRHRVHEWLLQETFDDKGNHTFYEYVQDDPALSLGEIQEVNRQYCQRYIRRIFYGNSNETVGPTRRGTDHEDHLAERDRRYLFEVLFDYGDLDRDGDPYVPADQGTDVATRDWPVRPDPFSSYRAGFEVRTLRRCERVLMVHHFAELGGATAVKSTDFEYQTNPDTLVSFLSSASVRGYRRVGNGYRSASMPPVTFTYSAFKPHEQRYQSVTAQGNDLPPQAIGDPDMALVDLFGSGLQDVLHTTPTGFRYWRNLGNGVLDRPRMLPRAPAGVTLSQPGVSFADMGGDGRVDLLLLDGPMHGFFETTADGAWQTFKPFRSLPSFSLADPSVRLLDLTGDGLTDVLLPREHDFLWFECRGEEGYAPPRATERVHDLNEFPDLAFDDPSGRVRLADMTGDGLTDIVLVNNGRVDYWPNLGYGRFGKRVTMANTPRLAPDADPARLFLADLDGSGSADLVYVDFDEVHFWFNRSGNGWSERQVVRDTPTTSSATSLRFGDFFGTGTTSLIWSEDLDVRRGGNYRVLDFCGRVKPHLLIEMSNNLGATTRVRYAASTRYALEDAVNGEPWVTTLPFPVQVLDKVEIVDQISRTRHVTTYRYHHGYFDGREREFRGFGRVDQLDTETFEAFEQPDLFPDDDFLANTSQADHVPPVETRTWFHTGIYYDQDRKTTGGRAFDVRTLTREYRREYYQLDPQAFRLGAAEVETGDAPHEAYRALRGAVLRTEVYGRDGTERAVHPYTVTESRHQVRQLQPKDGNHHAIYLVSPKETLAHQYERRPDDPRVSHQVTLQVDDFGNVLQAVAIGYGRRRDDPDPLLTDDDRRKQRRALMTLTENRFTNPIQQVGTYRAPLPCEARTYELLNVVPVPIGAQSPGRLSFEEVAHRVGLASDGQHDVPYEDVDGASAGSSDPHRRLIAHTRTLYRRDDLTGPLPLGQAQPCGLPFGTFTLALTVGLIEQTYGARLADPASVLAEGGYLQAGEYRAQGWFPDDGHDADWWTRAGQAFYSPNATDTPGQELAFARQHFFLTQRSRDPFGRISTLGYDPYDLIVCETSDPLGNRVTVGVRDENGALVAPGIDYRVLRPWRVMDPNGNCSAAAFDTLGVVVGTAVMGKPSEKLGDSLDGFEPDLADDVIAAHLQDPLADPHALLESASTRVVYDLFAYQRTRLEAQPRSSVVSTLARETHAADLAPGQRTKVRHSLTYTDGFGRQIQQKLPAEPGPLVEGGPNVSPRWVGSGWTIFNNKGKPVRRYEPFFSATHLLETDRIVGVSTILFYDPTERVVATLQPNHCYEKVVFDAWREENWGYNDTVLQADPKDDLDIGEFFRGLPDADYLPSWHGARAGGAFGPREQAAAVKAAAHANTPSVALFDSLGRTILTAAQNRFDRDGMVVDRALVSRVTLDTEGNQRVLVDARGRVVMRYVHDLLGRRIRQASMEAGERWLLNDSTGRQVAVWDSRGHAFRMTYDALRRPSETFVRTGTGVEILAERTVYGDSQPQPELQNLRGRISQVFDGAGIVRSEAFDFKGNLLRTSRQLLVDYKGQADWSQVPALEPEIFTSATRYDALNRVVQEVAPRGDRLGARVDILQPTYNEANLLERLDAWLQQPAEPIDLLDPATASAHVVANVDYDAKGQRERIEYGNGVVTTYEYDARTFRLTRIQTLRGTERLQDLSYTYDPSGNITDIRDDAQQTVYFRNQRVEPSADYTYDAVYRLIEAAGREHLGLAADGRGLPPTPSSYTDAPRIQLAHPGDGNALGRYRERYVYDDVGNILQLMHQGTDPTNPGWTRTYTYAEPSLLETGTTSNRLSSTETGSGARETYSYDAHGNVTVMPPLSLARWDCWDRLTATAQQIVNDGTPETTYYVYDGNGQRVRRVTERQAADGQTPTRRLDRVYLGISELYREYGGDGVMVTLERETLHVQDDTRRVALVETRTQGDDGSPPRLIRYQLSNHLDSASLELDNQAQIISYEEFTPYGSTSYQAVRGRLETPKRYRFTGKERDEESGLYYHGARYYAPWLGRWNSCDLKGLVDGPCVYSYCSGNPIALHDPTGMAGSSPLPGMIGNDPGVGKLWEQAVVDTLGKRFNATEYHEVIAAFQKEVVDRIAKHGGLGSNKAAGTAIHYARQAYSSVRTRFGQLAELVDISLKGIQLHHGVEKAGELAQNPAEALTTTNLRFASGNAATPGTGHNFAHEVSDALDAGAKNPGQQVAAQMRAQGINPDVPELSSAVHNPGSTQKAVASQTENLVATEAKTAVKAELQEGAKVGLKEALQSAEKTGLKEGAKVVGTKVAKYIPVIGIGVGVALVTKDLRDGDYTSAAWDAAEAIPVVGDVVGAGHLGLTAGGAANEGLGIEAVANEHGMAIEAKMRSMGLSADAARNIGATGAALSSITVSPTIALQHKIQNWLK